MEKLRPRVVLPMDPDHQVMDYARMAEWLKEKYPGILTLVHQIGATELEEPAWLYQINYKYYGL